MAVTKEAIEHGMGLQIQDRMKRIVEPDELAHRISLLKARDYANEMPMRAQTLDAYDHAATVRDIASAFVFAEVPVDRLVRAIAYCRALVECAVRADELGAVEGVV